MPVFQEIFLLVGILLNIFEMFRQIYRNLYIKNIDTYFLFMFLYIKYIEMENVN